ncbi:unnamed protein product [Cyclocybe aegerita]|uniref:Uncharacterized protein n=1 Tax=Cyclocybe aegerita TaxID=1973307 RepID=A0A8S0VVU6_CYCAE|nr:unnamed protein product [Cyclocybe aegerita]
MDSCVTLSDIIDSDSRSSRSGRSSNQPPPPLAPGQASGSGPGAPYGFSQQAGYAQAPQQGIFPPHPSAYPNQQHTQAHHPAQWGQPPSQGQQYPPAGYGNAPAFAPAAGGQPQIGGYGNVGQGYSQGFPPPVSYHQGQPGQALNAEGQLDSADNSLSHRDLDTLDEIYKARKLIQAAKMSYRSLAKYRQRHPHLQVQAISFSKITIEHLQSIGVSFIEKTCTDFQQSIIPKIMMKMQQKKLPIRVNFQQTFDGFWAHVLPSPFGLVAMVQNVLNTVGRKPEARGRILIDQFLLFVTILFRQLGAIPFIFPELHIASSTTSNTNECVILAGDRAAIMMSGSVDYAMIYTNLNDDDLARMLGISAKEAAKVRSQYLSTGTLSDLLEHSEMRGVMKNANTTQIFLIEAKKKELRLEDRVPQVVAECLASLSNNSMARTQLPWCLTNGIEWIFGLVQLQTIEEPRRSGARPQTRVERQSYYFPTFQLQHDMNGKLSQADVKTVFIMLMFWSMATPREISDFVNDLP